jgi:cell division protein FtsB
VGLTIVVGARGEHAHAGQAGEALRARIVTRLLRDVAVAVDQMRVELVQMVDDLKGEVSELRGEVDTLKETVGTLKQAVDLYGCEDAPRCANRRRLGGAIAESL